MPVTESAFISKIIPLVFKTQNYTFFSLKEIVWCKICCPLDLISSEIGNFILDKKPTIQSNSAKFQVQKLTNNAILMPFKIKNLIILCKLICYGWKTFIEIGRVRMRLNMKSKFRLYLKKGIFYKKKIQIPNI